MGAKAMTEETKPLMDSERHVECLESFLEKCTNSEEAHKAMNAIIKMQKITIETLEAQLGIMKVIAKFPSSSSEKGILSNLAAEFMTDRDKMRKALVKITKLNDDNDTWDRGAIPGIEIARSALKSKGD